MEVRLQVGQTERRLQVNDQEGKFESWESPIKTNKKNELAFTLYLIKRHKSKFLLELMKKNRREWDLNPR